MELGSIWLGGFRFGVLDCPPGTPVPKAFTKPTPALLTRAAERTGGVDGRKRGGEITKGEDLWTQAYCCALLFSHRILKSF